MTERELKLALPGRFTIPPLSIGADPLSLEPLADVSLRATYYDTADLRLARHGVTLRYRTGEEGGPRWTLKLPQAAADAQALERHELNFSGPAREPPAEARTLVTAYARAGPLVAVATLRTKRRRMHLVAPGAEGRPVAELAIDEVSVVDGRRVVSRFRELEVEDLTGDLDLPVLARQLEAAGATGTEPIPKVVRALGSRATAPPDVVMPAPPPGACLADALRVAVASALLRVVEHDPLARLGEPEGVHQVRVAFRRLRSDLRTLGDAVDEEWLHRIEPRLRMVSAALGAARDLDVLADRLHEDAADATAALAPFFDELVTRRAAARAALRARLEAPEYAALLDELVAAIDAPPAGPAGTMAATTGLPRLAMAAWRRFERRAISLGPDSADAEFHRARVAAKRARYAAELAARLLAGRRAEGATKLARRIARAQDQLGSLQDAAVADVAVRDTLARHHGSAYTFEAGRLVERQRAHAAAARSAFLAAWPKLRGGKLISWAS